LIVLQPWLSEYVDSVPGVIGVIVVLDLMAAGGE